MRLKIAIEAQSTAEPLTCEGETVVVNFHGALLSTATVLRVDMQIEVHVLMTGKRASAKVVYVDPETPRLCGIALDQPKNIWGVSLPPEDWPENESGGTTE